MLRYIRFINEMLAKIEILWKDLEHHLWFNDYIYIYIYIKYEQHCDFGSPWLVNLQ